MPEFAKLGLPEATTWVVARWWKVVPMFIKYVAG